MLVAAVAIGYAASKPPGLTKHDKAYYASQTTIDFVRPGLVLKIQSASIASDGTIQTQFTLTDVQGLPLDKNGVTSPGPISVQMVAATIAKGQRQYTAYTTQFIGPPTTKQGGNLPAADTGGAFAKLGDGQYTYTFATRAPAGFDPSATHTIGAIATRDLTEFKVGKNYSNDVYSFVPNGSKVTVIRDVVQTSSSCDRCHTSLNYHQGTTRDVALCVLCHTPQNTDLNTGQSLDFPAIIHKLHAGTEIDSVAAGGAFVISVDNFTSSRDYSIYEFVTQTRDCQICHQPGPTQANAWLKNPTRAACGACHDTTNFVTGANHNNLPQIDDSQCANCHVPQGELPLDASIIGGHTVPAYSSTLPGVIFDLQRVDNAGPGKAPTVSFTVKDKSGQPIKPSQMDRLALVIAGPTSDYAGWVREDASKARVASDGSLSYTFQKPLPANAAGTFTVGIEGRRILKFLPGTTKETETADVGTNKMLNFSVDNSPIAARRTIVSAEKCASCHQPQPTCNTCHNDSFHNANRNQFDYCVMCHNPNETDQAQRTPEQMPAESMDFAGLVHKIHTGENRVWRSIYGIGGVEDGYPTIRFPSDRGNCDTCHVNGSEQLPVAANLLSITNPVGPINPMGRTTEACLGCHDNSPSAISHALANTSILGESCDVCHGQGAAFEVNKVHAH